MSHAEVARILALSVEKRLRQMELIWESLSTSSNELTLAK
jgi:hypothetical protein